MNLYEKNQLFIDSIWHWITDGVDQFDYGKHIPNKHYTDYWSDGTICKLKGTYCPLCINFDDDCDICFINNHKICCKAYNQFLASPSKSTCNGVIDYLWITGYQMDRIKYEKLSYNSFYDFSILL